MATFFVIFIWATLPCVEIAYITHTPCETTWQPQNIIALSSLEMLLLLCCLFGLYFIFLFRGQSAPKLWPSFRLFGHRKKLLLYIYFLGFVFLHILWFNQRKLYTHAEWSIPGCALENRIPQMRVVIRRFPLAHSLTHSWCCCWGNKTETWPNSENWCRLCFRRSVFFLLAFLCLCLHIGGPARSGCVYIYIHLVL